ncbi:putative MFS general substrate transporter [Lyophyllum shimeji]|uniref:MFS general substrate transporter n=1 Tax=Lyophyllum shimeji TaxID=47721 RepID=A0A9P3UJR0_LYOSH|nr:putative MFS general substrate transporter [Lyophyllum shimeji]
MAVWRNGNASDYDALTSLYRDQEIAGSTPVSVICEDRERSHYPQCNHYQHLTGRPCPRNLRMSRPSMSPEPEPPTEATPLLTAESDPALKFHHQLAYQRFSRRQKWAILVLVSWCGLIPLFVSGTFIPSIPQIAADLDTTAPIVNLAVSLSIFAASLGSLSAAAYSTFYGRRPIYLVSLPLLCIGSFGVARSQSVAELMVWRFVQAFGASPGMSVGAGAIGDIYRLEERGQAMGIFFAASLLGPALAPPIGGFAAEYASWRLMQSAMGAVGAIMFVCMLIFFPETSHPGMRGIDRLAPHTRRLRFVNPLQPLVLLRSPSLMAVSFGGYLVLLTDFVLLVPLAYTIGATYNITNPALIGACFLPAGIGNMIGAPLAGRISDHVVVQYRLLRGGAWYPEDRLRATLPGALVLVPVSILVAGFLTQWVPGIGGLVGVLVCLFFNGVGVDIVLSPSAAYAVDIMHERSAEAMAATVAFRALLLSLSVSAILPLIETIGVAATNGISAVLAWVGCLVLWCTIRYGEQMRKWVDVGYSTAEST